METQEQIDAVISNPSAIQFIENPSVRLQWLAVKYDPQAIEWIKNPDPEVVKKAVKRTGYCIRFISDPSIDLQRIAIESQPSSLHFIKNPTPEITRMALEADGNNIRYIKNPSEELQLIAVNGISNLDLIENPTLSVVVEVIKYYVKRGWRNQATDFYSYLFRTVSRETREEVIKTNPNFALYMCQIDSELREKYKDLVSSLESGYL